MHETSICQRILEEARQAGATKSITIEVGDLGHCSGEEIKETMERLTKEFEIKILKKKNKVHCPQCEFTGEATILEKGHGYAIYECPQCKNKKDLKILEGGAIKIIEVE